MLRFRALPREAIYCYLLLLGVLLFQLRYMPPVSEYAVLASHIQVLFFIGVALLSRGAKVSLGNYDNKILLLCAAFFFLALVSTINSVDTAAAYTRWYCYLASFLLAMGVMLALRSGLMNVAGIFASVLLACAVLVLAELRDVVQEWQMYREMNQKFLWMPLYFNHIRNFAHVPFAGVLLAAWLVCYPGGGWRIYLGILLTLVFMTALLWSGGRAPLVVLPLMAYVFYLLLPAIDARRLLVVWLLSAGIGFGLLQASANDFMLQNALDRFDDDIVRVTRLVRTDAAQQQSTTPDSQTIGSLGTGRGKHWRQGLILWQEHPLFGSGADAFFVDSGYSSTHPHNWVVRILLEFGVVGISLVLLILGSLLWPAVVLIRTKPSASVSLSVATTLVLAWLGYGALSGNLYFSWSLSVFAIAIAIVGDALGRQYLLSAVVASAEREPTRYFAGSCEAGEVSQNAAD